MTKADIIARLINSSKGMTPDRIAKAKTLADRNGQGSALMELVARLPNVTSDILKTAHHARLKQIDQCVTAAMKADETNAEAMVRRDVILKHLETQRADEIATFNQSESI